MKPISSRSFTYLIDDDADSSARWCDYPCSVRIELESKVTSLKYNGNLLDWLNPEIKIYHEDQGRKQRWTGYPGAYSDGEALHYFADVGSTGVKPNNSSHFDTSLTGPLKLDASFEWRQSKKKVDSLSDGKLYTQYMESYDAQAVTWDPDFKIEITRLSLALNIERDTPWQASAGVCYQKIKLDVLNSRYFVVNIKQGGILRGSSYYYNFYRQQGYSRAEAKEMTVVTATEENSQLYHDTSANAYSSRLVSGDRNHECNPKLANFASKYTALGTGLTIYGRAGYNERAPVSNEMYINGSWLKTELTANPYLKSEKNLSLQLAANYLKKDWPTTNDALDINTNHYRNKIRNRIIGPTSTADQGANEDSFSKLGGTVANINSLKPFIRHEFKPNLSYRQPLFYVRSNLTIPTRHDNKICAWESPIGQGHHISTDTSGTLTFTPTGKGDRLCYSSWNWMEAGTIEPIHKSPTAALTPHSGKWEFGGTLHYRGRQQNPEVQATRLAMRYNDLTVEREKSQFMPHVSLYASHDRIVSDTVNNKGRDYKTNTINLQVSIPLFSSGSSYYSTRQVNDRLVQARYELECTANTTETTQEQYCRVFRTSPERVRTLRRNVADATPWCRPCARAWSEESAPIPMHCRPNASPTWLGRSCCALM
ncbi:TolC family protein [Azorhizophilus paspali]|uniref:TolC family protein n=1 Tax=Azorhizophilus paspali TaxID=69963 RepID=UPI00363C12F9